MLAAIATVVAIARYFMKGWVEPLGVPTIVGSLLASVTVILIVGLVVIFSREGRNPEGKYLRAALWFGLLAIWCELLVIGGILLSERTGASTYYQGPWEAVHDAFPTPGAHAVGHTQGFFFRLAVALIIGGVIYLLARRRQKPAAPSHTT